MSINIMDLGHATSYNTSDSLLLTETSNEGKRMNIATFGPLLSKQYTSAGFYGTLPTDTNLDNVTDAGSYALTSGNNYTNTPSGVTFGVLEVTKGTNSAAMLSQKIITSGGATFVRFHGTSTWSAWVELQRAIIASGSAPSISGDSEAPAERTISFGITFPNAPIVTCTAIHSSATYPIVVSLKNVTTTNFVARVQYWSTANVAWVNSKAAFKWVAVHSN